MLLDSYVVLHEFATFFVQNLVSYERHYNVLSLAPDEATSEPVGKECSNLIILLSDYNFQAISCIFLYDIIRSYLRRQNSLWSSYSSSYVGNNSSKMTLAR